MKLKFHYPELSARRNGQMGVSVKYNIMENIKESIACKEALLEDSRLMAVITDTGEVCVDAFLSGNKILVCGNGGSASDAQHMAGELVGRYLMERRGLPAIALPADAAVMTALSNDYDYEDVFARQVRALGREGDILFGISTSGNSSNVVKALEEARKMGIVTVGLTGRTGGRMKECCDYLLNVTSDRTPRIQEMHIMLIHIICGIIEEQLASCGFFDGQG